MPRAKRIHRYRTLSELLPEFHPTKNGSQSLQDFTRGSFKKVWWVCEDGHEWIARVCNRTRGTGCPVCSRRLKKTELPLVQWISRNRKIGFGKSFRKLKDASPGIVQVEMPVEAWEMLPILTVTDEELAVVIREYRRRKGLSQTQFASMVGHHRNYIGMIERGEFKGMTYKDYQRIMSVILE